MSQSHLPRVGPPTPHYIAVLRKLQVNCSKRKDPNIIYMTVDMRDQSHTEWGFNTPKHFSCKELTPDALMDNIHPVWRDIYTAFKKENYKIVADLVTTGAPLKASFQFTLPLRRKDDKFYWFKQVVYPVTYDAHNNVVHFMKELRKVTDFDKLVPEPPRVVLENGGGEQYTQRLQAAGNAVFQSAFSHLISPAGFELLNTYRKLSRFEGGKWVAPDKTQVERVLGLSRTALNKAVVRFLGSVKHVSPGIVTENIGGFAGFLNDFLGKPT